MSSIKSRIYHSNNTIYLSSIYDFNPFLVLGDIEGNIHISKLIALSFEKNKIAENINKSRLCQSKAFAGHVSFVNQIEVNMNGDSLFTTGINDQCVFQWKIHKAKKVWEMDHLDYDINREDIFFSEVEPKDKYTTAIEQYLPLRDEIVAIKQNIDENCEPEIYIELDRVIGRKAYNRKNNLFYSQNNQLIFSSGSLIVGLQIPPVGQLLEGDFHHDYFQQSFLEPDSENIFNTNPEISCMAICRNRKFLCIGTSQTQAKLIIWELTSRTFMKSMTLSDCCTILMLKYAYDTRMIACVALTKNYTQVVYLIDTYKSIILGASNLLYTLPFKIKDLEFLPMSKTEFITCGVQHMSLWNYKGGLLNFKELPIQNVKQGPSQDDLIGDNFGPQNGSSQLLRIAFISIIFVLDEFIVTGGDDGCVSSFPNALDLHLERFPHHQKRNSPSSNPSRMPFYLH